MKLGRKKSDQLYQDENGRDESKGDASLRIEVENIAESSSKGKKPIKAEKVTEVMTTEARIDVIKNQEREKYRQEAEKSFFGIMKNGAKFDNATKLLLIAIGGLANGVTANPSAIFTYSLAAATCLAPVLIDLKENYKQIQTEIIKEGKKESRWERLKQYGKFIYPSVAGLGIGIVSIGVHIGLNITSHLSASDAVIAIGTFLAGSSHMLVNPLVRKEVAKRKLNEIIGNNLTAAETSRLLEEGMSNRVEEVENSIIIEADEKQEEYLNEFLKLVASIKARPRMVGETIKEALSKLQNQLDLKEYENEALRREKAELVNEKLDLETDNKTLKENLIHVKEEKVNEVEKLKEQYEKLNTDLKQTKYQLEEANKSNTGKENNKEVFQR